MLVGGSYRAAIERNMEEKQNKCSRIDAAQLMNNALAAYALAGAGVAVMGIAKTAATGSADRSGATGWAIPGLIPSSSAICIRGGVCATVILSSSGG